MKIEDFYIENNKYNYTLSLCGKKEENYYLGLSYFESAKLLSNAKFNDNCLDIIQPN